MQVKCLICGKLIDKKTAYCIPTKNRNNYYCSKEEYLARRREIEAFNKALEVIAECYQYCTGYAEPPYSLVKKELSDNLKVIPIETVKAFVEENREKLKKTINRKIEINGQFQSFYFEVRYISGIIKREILEKKWEESKPEPQTVHIGLGDIDFYSNPISENHIKRRRPLNELEDEADGN